MCCFIKKMKEERGNFTIFTLFIVIGIMAIAAVFMNVAMTHMTINSSKKAMEESVRTRALAVDIPLKEHEGVIEIIHQPYALNPNLSYARPVTDLFGNVLPTPGSVGYKNAVADAEYIAKASLVQTTARLIGNNVDSTPLVDIDFDNICYDVEPLPEDNGYIDFACALKDDNGNTFTVKSTQLVKGFNDIQGINHSDQTNIRVTNVVFGAAIIEPKSFIVNALASLGVAKNPRIVLYSVAYPQIDECYGEFC